MNGKELLEGLRNGTLQVKGPEKPSISSSGKKCRNQIMKLRTEYISCHKLANETDSKKEEAILKQEAAQALAELGKLCPHDHTVCLYSEYAGSYSMDYDDHHPEARVCLCCGIKESAYNDKWKTLTTKPFSRFENKYPDQIKYPLNYLLADTVEIAEIQGYHYFGHRGKSW
jgi:hypothetical protein